MKTLKKLFFSQRTNIRRLPPAYNSFKQSKADAFLRYKIGGKHTLLNPLDVLEEYQFQINGTDERRAISNSTVGTR